MEIIYKVGGIIVRSGKILVARKENTFLIPGGKIKRGEKAEECLRREIMEELGVKVISQQYFGDYEDEAALDPGKLVSIKVFTLIIKGEPSANAEIKEVQYINSRNIGKIKLGSVVEKFIIPKLLEKKVID